MPEDSQLDSIPVRPVRHRQALRRHWAMNIVGIGGTLTLCYYGEAVLAVILISILLAFVLAPVVDLLTWIHLPRGLAAFVAVILLLAVLSGLVYYSYSQAASFLHDLPQYTSTLREQFMSFRQKAESLEALGPDTERNALAVRPAKDWTSILTHGFGS